MPPCVPSDPHPTNVGPGHCRSRGKRLGTVLVGLLLLPALALAWWQPDWAFRKAFEVRPAPPENAPPVVPVRLHAGNFDFFQDLRSDGADLRAIAGDDAAPLPFHLEMFDPDLSMAVVWVRLPTGQPAADGVEFYLYYGHRDAQAADDAAASYGPDTLAAYHFSGVTGLPRDATAYGLDALASTAQPAAPGVLHSGLGFRGGDRLELPAHPRLAAEALPLAGSLWIKPESLAGTAELLRTADGTVGLTLEDGIPTLEADGATVRAAAPLDAQRWQHVAFTIGDRTSLYVDGVEAASGPGPGAKPRNAPFEIGSGFIGALDELVLRSVPMDAAQASWIVATQGPDAQAVVPGADASREGSGFMQLGLLWTVLASVRLEGWFVILLILALGWLSADTMIGKHLMLRRMEREDERMRTAFEDEDGEDDPAERLHHSSLAALYRTAVAEAGRLEGERLRPLDARELEVVRNAVEETLSRQVERLEARLLWMTIAVSGGPFLGLLGTVIGVMVTFATIAAAGDVNVQTIAPGVSAALTTTVMGLLVAIPSLFGYNFVAARIGRRVTAMERFADRLMSRLALAGAGAGAGREAPEDEEERRDAA